MNILIATGIYPPDIGGPATYSKLLAEELTKRGHGVTVVSYCDSSGASRVPFLLVGVSRALPKGVRHILYMRALVRYGKMADLIYAQDPVSVGVPALFASRILRKPFAVKIVGDYAWEQGMQRFGVRDLLDTFLKKRYGFFVEALRTVEAAVARRASRIVVPSEYLKGVVRAWGVDAAKVAVVPNSFSLPPLSHKDDARRELGITGALIISIGRLVPWKGFGVLIDAMKDMNAELAIIGDGPLRNDLERRASEGGVHGRVHFTGSLSREKLAAYLAAADIFCLNTAYEGMSHQVLEAMAAGVPVVTTLEGGNREIIKDGENALAVTLNDKEGLRNQMNRLLNDPELRRRLGERALEVRAHYTADRMVDRTIRVFEDICAS